MHKILKFNVSCSLIAVMAGAIAAPAAAQDETAAETVGVEEIVVTAQKREQNLQDTPLSIVALGEKALEQRGINSLNDLFTGAIPSVRIAPFVGRASAVSIGMRGLVPFDATQVSRDPTVGVYIDGIYLGRVSGLGLELADVERIEVLRGPQGTLFGRNAVGGAISVVSKRPTGEFGLDMRAGIGNFSSRSAAAHLNLPEVAGVSVKIDGLFEQRDGFVRNPLRTSNDYGELDKLGFRVAALWEPADNLSILYAYDYSKERPTNLYYHLDATAQAASRIPTFVTIDTGRVHEARVGLPVPVNPQKADGHSITAEWDVADNLTIRSISAWRSLDSTQWEQDGGMLTSWGPNRLFGRLSFANVSQNQFSQELQFVGEAGDFEYVFGGYYFREKAQDVAIVYSSGVLNATNSGVNLFPEPVPDRGTAIPDRASQARVRSKALFGQVTWSPSAAEGVHLTLGARYTDDHKDGRITVINGADPNLTFVFNSKRLDPMATLAYDISEDVNLYVRWSRAYRAGGANSRSFAFTPFGEEELSAWEAGMKADLFDRRVRLNLAAYTSTLNDQQVDFINPANVSNTETRNAPEQRKIKGIEADLTVVPTRGLTLTANYVYTDAPPTPVRNPFTGNTELVFASFTRKHAGTLAVDYEFPELSFGQFRLHLNAETVGDVPWFQTPTIRTEDKVLFNGRFTLGEVELGGGEWEFALWGKNLFNSTYELLNVNLTLIGRQSYAPYNDPRTYGLEARMRF
ncbi:MAG: TonB-dependent receptor [Porphyrobacter sp.]|jgi:iron complex outermembrane receptor protein|nr:TonB-dependent receptor [Porphyrobacter sp.]